MAGKNILSKFIPCPVCLCDRSVGGFSGHFAWITVVCEQQLSYRVPGLAQCEAIVPVEVVLVESYLNGFLDHVHGPPHQEVLYILIPVQYISVTRNTCSWNIGLILMWIITLIRVPLHAYIFIGYIR
jgi:hypothetical protein